MGASCIGKTKEIQQRKIQNKSNTLSSQLNSQKGELHIIVKKTLPTIVFKTYQPNSYIVQQPLSIHNQLNNIHKEYKYQQSQYQPDKSQDLISNYATKTQKGNNEQPIIYNSICSILQRQEMSKERQLIIHNSINYLSFQSHKDQKIIQGHKKHIEIQKFGEQQIKIQFNDKIQPDIPDKIILISLQINKKNISMHKKCYELHSKEDLDVIMQQIELKFDKYTYFATPFLSGLHFTMNNAKASSNTHFISKILSIDKPLSQQNMLLLYSNHYKHTNKHHNNPYRNYEMRLSYFQISQVMQERSQNIWSTHSIQQMQTLFGKQIFQVYISLQILKCIVDNLQRSYFKSNLDNITLANLYHQKCKLINNFMKLEDNTMKDFIFLLQLYLLFHNISQKDKISVKVQEIIISIIKNMSFFNDGIFYQFGYQINQKEHPFKLQSFCFIQSKSKIQAIKHLQKDMVYPSAKIINVIKEVLTEICCNMKEINITYVEDKQLSALKLIQQRFSSQMQKKINQLYIHDFRFRIKLIKYYIQLIRSNISQNKWKEVQNSIHMIQFIQPETLVFFFTLAALTSTIIKSSTQRTINEEFYYMKALDISHKLYGDPRANRQYIQKQQEQIWQLLILQNFCSLYKAQNEKKEYHYLNNILQCLKEDFKHIIPQLIQQWSLNEEHNEIFLKNSIRIIKYLPVRKISGYFLKRSQVYQHDLDDSKSSCSQTYSVSSKRQNKLSYKIKASQFNFKLSQNPCVIRWGQNIAAAPDVLPPLKNKTVLSISSGNYHIVFLTEAGIFGWGDNHSGQLGNHNLQKIYLKQTAFIKNIKINSKKDRFQISCGNQHSAVLLNGFLYMWGQSQGGIISGDGFKFDYVACGGLHTLGIIEGKVFSWGRGEGGQLGHPLHILNQKKKQQSTQYYIDNPKQIKSITAFIIKVVCGDAHSLVLSSEGKVYVFGFCYQGQLGLGLTGQNQQFQIFEPREQCFFNQKVIDIFAGPTFSFFKTERHQIYSCGMNDCLQLGIDRVMKIFQKKKYINRTVQFNYRRKLGEQQFSKPRKLDFFNDKNMNLIDLECGQNHCLAQVRYMGAQNMLMGWGLNKSFQIDINFSQATTPRTIDSIFQLPILEICCGSTYSLANIGSNRFLYSQIQQKLIQILERSNNQQILLHP